MERSEVRFQNRTEYENTYGGDSIYVDSEFYFQNIDNRVDCRGNLYRFGGQRRNDKYRF